MADVFMSCAPADRAAVEPIVKALQGRGFDVFWDANAAPGVAAAQLAGACAVVAVWSQASAAAPVPQDIDTGKDREILVPIFLDAVSPPAGYSQFQGEHLAGYPAPPADVAFERVVTVLQQRKAAAAAAASPHAKRVMPQTVKASAPPARGGIGKFAAPALIAAGLLVVGYLALNSGQKAGDETVVAEPGGPLGVRERYGLSDTEIASLAPDGLIRKAMEKSSFEALDSAAAEDKLSLGLLCLAQYYGVGTPRDDAAAAQTCARARAQGTGVATYVLSLITRAGQGGVTADAAAADALLQEAATAGDARAQRDIAIAQRTSNPAAARREAEKCAAQGNIDCRFTYAQMLAGGEGGKKDLVAAKTAYDALATGFYAPAIRELGKFYRDGVGVNRDLEEAVTHFQRAAVLDDGEASYRLGELAEAGTGLPKSNADAIAFYEEAKIDGYAEADAAITRLRDAK